MRDRPRKSTAAALLGARQTGLGLRVGWFTVASRPNALVVGLDGGGAVAARSTVSIDEKTLSKAVANRQGVVVMLEEGDPSRLIVLGLVDEPDPPGLRLLVNPIGRMELEADVDGRKLQLRASERLELACGNASITLTSDGKIVLRGVYIETNASATNRIKGGHVKIN
jgi:hypothetical protein